MSIVTTTLGPMDDAVLERRRGVEDCGNESTHWEEYWFEGNLVHRSVHLTLRQPVEALGMLGEA